MADIQAVQLSSDMRLRIAEQRLTGQALKDAKATHAGIQRLAAKIFREAAQRELSMDDIITTVYISGLWHGAEIKRQEERKEGWHGTTKDDGGA